MTNTGGASRKLLRRLRPLRLRHGRPHAGHEPDHVPVLRGIAHRARPDVTVSALWPAIRALPGRRHQRLGQFPGLHPRQQTVVITHLALTEPDRRDGQHGDLHHPGRMRPSPITLASLHQRHPRRRRLRVELHHARCSTTGYTNVTVVAANSNGFTTNYRHPHGDCASSVATVTNLPAWNIQRHQRHAPMDERAWRTGEASRCPSRCYYGPVTVAPPPPPGRTASPWVPRAECLRHRSAISFSTPLITLPPKPSTAPARPGPAPRSPSPPRRRICRP